MPCAISYKPITLSTGFDSTTSETLLTHHNWIKENSSADKPFKQSNLPRLRMATKALGDLPAELLLKISRHLAEDPDLRSSQQLRRPTNIRSSVNPLKPLRLVNKTFAEILASELFRSVKIDNEAKGAEFLKWYNTLQPNDCHRIKRLSVGKVLPARFGRDDSGLSYPVFENVIARLAPNLIQLEVEFMDCFEFSPAILKNFARCSHLSTLHLKLSPRRHQDPHHNSTLASVLIAHPDPSFGSLQPEAHSGEALLDALEALPSLIHLDLNECLDRCAVPPSKVTKRSLPSICSLSVDLQPGHAAFLNDQHISLRTLAHSFKSSLTKLSIRGSRYDSSKLTPVLEAVSTHLRTLHLSETSIVEHCDQLRFPQLHTICLDDSRFPGPHQFSSPFFQSASTLVFRTWNAGLDTNDSQLQIPVTELPQLKQVVLTYTAKPTKATVQLYKACAESDVALFLTGQHVDL